MGIDVIVSHSLNYTHFMYIIGKELYLDIVTVVMIFLFSFLSLHFSIFFLPLEFLFYGIRTSFLVTRYCLAALPCLVTPLLFEGTFAPRKSLAYNHW